MSKTYLDMYLRHKYLLTVPVIVAFLVGSLLGFLAPRQYEVEAAIWADSRVPAESTVGSNGGEDSPSAGQSSLLSQLLATRTFRTAVAEASPLADDFREADPIAADQMLTALAASIEIVTPGPQLLAIVVEGKDPDDTLGVASALIDEFRNAQVEQATARAHAEVEYRQQQVEFVQETVRDSDSRANRVALTNAQEALTESRLAETAVGSQLQVVDKPEIAFPQSRRKTILLGAVGGLFAGLTVSLLALLWLVARENPQRGSDSDGSIKGEGPDPAVSDPSHSSRKPRG